jgi:hypothetical protein
LLLHSGRLSSYSTSPELSARRKHSNLFPGIVNYSCKKFYKMYRSSVVKVIASSTFFPPSVRCRANNIKTTFKIFKKRSNFLLPFFSLSTSDSSHTQTLCIGILRCVFYHCATVAAKETIQLIQPKNIYFI